MFITLYMHFFTPAMRMSNRASTLCIASVCSILLHAATAGYSESGQDVWVLSLFPDKQGYFLDVGSWHTELASNSKALEDKGWQGICVEPFGVGYDQRSCQLESVVVSDYPGQLLKFQVAGPFSGVRATMTTEQLAKYKDEFAKGYVRAKASSTVGTVLQRQNAPSYVEYLSIDVEGHELQVLKGVPFWKYTFGAITVDYDDNEQKKKCIQGLLEYHGYSLVKVMGQDLAFVRNASQPRPSEPLSDC